MDTKGSLDPAVKPRDDKVMRVTYLREMVLAINYRWTFKRQVIDFKNSSRQFGVGTAAVENNVYTESGIWKFPGQEGIPFEHRYNLCLIKPDKLEIKFPDNRLFFTIGLRHANQTFYHQCGEDHYYGTLQACSFERFLISWQVKGPRKDYKMLTLWQPIPSRFLKDERYILTDELDIHAL